LIVKLTKDVTEEKRTSKAGKDYDVLFLVGNKKDQSGQYSADTWKKDIPTWDDIASDFRDFKAGDEINIKMVKDGQFWKVEGVSKLGAGGGGGSSSQSKSRGGGSFQSPAAGQFRSPEEIIRTSAIEASVKLLGNLASNQEVFGKALKKTLTQEGIRMILLENAESFEAFIKGGASGKVTESDNSALKGGSGDLDDNVLY